MKKCIEQISFKKQKMCGYRVQKMVVTMEVHYCKKITWYVKCSNTTWKHIVMGYYYILQTLEQNREQQKEAPPVMNIKYIQLQPILHTYRFQTHKFKHQ